MLKKINQNIVKKVKVSMKKLIKIKIIFNINNTNKILLLLNKNSN